ncbi:DUF4129 domain-containing protein [Paenibacillus kobensis]|uniref:DUF4129 domain-containing protein n=1 Tax=Paenibacillus kobensis TaxID=59841 RepID=UPI000FD84D9F|nr:DUF4129 domain-containing protein [Paenibacillus kobensis]
MSTAVRIRTSAAHIALRSLFIALLLLPAIIALALYAVPDDARLQWIIAVPVVFASGDAMARVFAGKRRWLADTAAVLIVLAYDYWTYGTTSIAVLSAIVYAAIVVSGTLRPRDGSIWSVPPAVFITSFFLYAIVSFVLQKEPDSSFYSRMLNIGGAVTLILALFLFNRSMVRKESYSDNNGGTVSKSILWQNRILVGILSAVALIVSFLSDISGWIRRMFEQFINQLKKWLDSQPPAAKPGPISDSGEQAIMPLDSAEPNRWIELIGTVMQYIGTALAVAAILWMLYKIIRKMPFLARMIEKWVQRMMGKERLAAEQAGYADETEQIDHAPLADRFRRFASGLIPGRTADEWDRLPDNASRIRYLYRSAMQARQREGYIAKVHLTPRETARDLHDTGSAMRELPETIVNLYERARYGGPDIHDDEAEAARTLEKPSKKP